ncbi:hypothetical protein L9F63_015801, partial [Diploptera punctata]
KHKMRHLVLFSSYFQVLHKFLFRLTTIPSSSESTPIRIALDFRPVPIWHREEF